jgi:hypothetical protein
LAVDRWEVHQYVLVTDGLRAETGCTGLLLRTTTRTLLAAATTTALTLAVATPASAGTTVRYCANGPVHGYVEASGGGTFEPGGDCGTLSVRVRYSHVGGSSWTNWDYDPTGAAVYVKNGNVGHHRATIGSLDFTSSR